MPVLITAGELDALLAARAGTTVLDVRWTLAVPDGRPAYLAGHVPTAVYVDLDSELAAHGAPTDGRHPLPEIGALQDAARRWGLRSGDTVVVYDDGGNLAAARAWWLLRHAGVADVRILDGGLGAWLAAGLPVADGASSASEGDVTLAYGHLATLTIDAAAELAGSGLLVDARAGERYRGETEPVDPRAGHIPGAVSAPTGENLTADGFFLDAATLRARFAALGAEEGATTGVYCGSGVTAAHAAAALTIAGFTPALYPGSWSQWSNHPDRPVATGPLPEGEAA